MLASFNPAKNLLQDFGATHFHWSARARSVLALIGLGLLASAPLAYLFWRDWQLRRGFRRYCASPERKGGDERTAASTQPRPPLLAGQKAKPQPLSGRSEQPTADPAELHLAKTTSLIAPAGALLATTQAAAATAPQALGLGLERGVVSLQADNDHYEVYVDGAFVGNTPAKLSLDEAVHVVQVRRSGYREYRRELTVNAGSELNLRVVLQKLEQNPAEDPD